LCDEFVDFGFATEVIHLGNAVTATRALLNLPPATAGGR
jgi:hypothetical protein